MIPHLLGIGQAVLIEEAEVIVPPFLVGREVGWRRSPSEGRLVYVDRNRARHVGVNRKQFRGGLHAHQIDDERTPIAALRDKLRISEALRQLGPGTSTMIGDP